MRSLRLCPSHACCSALLTHGMPFCLLLILSGHSAPDSWRAQASVALGPLPWPFWLSGLLFSLPPNKFLCTPQVSNIPCYPFREVLLLLLFLTSRKYICPALVSYSFMFLSTHHYLHLCIYLGGYLLNACLPRYSLLPRDEAHPERFRAAIPNLFGTRNRWFLRESNA